MTVVGALALLVASMGAAAARASSASTPLAGASYGYELVRSGSKAAPGIAYSAIISVVGAALPSAGQVPALDPIVQPALPALAQQLSPVVQDVSAAGQSAADRGEQVAAPLAPVNPATNALVGGAANALDAVAAASNGAIQPFARTLNQVAQLLRLMTANDGPTG